MYNYLIFCIIIYIIIIYIIILIKKQYCIYYSIIFQKKQIERHIINFHFLKFVIYIKSIFGDFLIIFATVTKQIKLIFHILVDSEHIW